VDVWFGLRLLFGWDIHRDRTERRTLLFAEELPPQHFPIRGACERPFPLVAELAFDELRRAAHTLEARTFRPCAERREPLGRVQEGEHERDEQRRHH
jgi:hypothetical protein